MKTFWIVFGVVVTVGVLTGSYFLFNPGGGVKAITIVNYKTTDKEKPKVETKETFKDLGKIKVSEKKSAEFTIKNIGQKTLQLYNVFSSCGCTTSQIVVNGQSSDEFGMHSQSRYVAEVLPGKQARIRVIYRPYVMPVYGLVEREVYLSTNDPDNQKLVFKVKAYVK